MSVATENLHSISEAAEHLGITEALVRRYCREGRIGSRVGKVWVISADELKLFSQIPRRRGRKTIEHNGSNGNSRKSSPKRLT